MPVEVRDALKTAAEQHGRTLNAEMVTRLRESLKPAVDFQALAESVERNGDVAAKAIEGISTLESRMTEHISTMSTLLSKFAAGEIVVKDKNE